MGGREGVELCVARGKGQRHRMTGEKGDVGGNCV